MTHDDAILLLSARLDGPLPPDQARALDAWLAEAPDHRILADAFQAQHADLTTAFEDRREAARQTAAAVARKLPPPSPAPEPGRWRRVLAAPLPAGIAAAVLIGVGLLVARRDKPEHHSTQVVVAAADPIARFALVPKPKPDAPKAAVLKSGETLTTLAGEKRRVTLPDGSLLYLNQKTRVELTADRHVKLLAGEVFVEAVPATSDADLFHVTTPKRSVTALGTKFAVTATDEATGVRVTQGKVEVSGLDRNLTSGQELALGADKIVPGPRASAALDWARDLMVAAESPLVPAGKYSGGSLVAVDPYGQEAKLRLVNYHIDVHVEDGFARTTIDQTYFNSENQRMEGTFYFPLPPDASLSRLAMYVEGNLMEGGMAEREQARDAYETIRYQNRDPALLEWVDGSVFKMRVFPLEARQEKRIVLSYTQKLPVLYGRATYRFPAGHTLAMVDHWSFSAFVKDAAAMSPASPSHPTMKMEARGRDLVLTDTANGVKVDRDVVLELTDHQAQAQGDRARWSMGELDGQKYLMLRFRPDLPTAPRRERRDWVVLFESSGARDPLVARAQVEVVRSLLTHAEHDDTFAVLTVGTRVRKWKDSPVEATTENVGEAVAWLEKAHLIGATNLDQALSDVEPLLRAGSNPHLVHVGGGIASIGEQRAEELVKRIPPGTRYVGIGVGRKFSPAFMKTAAERTGGLFTQVNPDEPMTWRGFEIASTLNAPRLLNVTVAAADGPRFLTFGNALAHGEEFAAVANVTQGMPTSVTVRGVLDGVQAERVVPVENVADGAGYLPRTWAKLEIDRLMADGSVDHRKAVTDLSKAMYVMTPFTSLLVLENEQMYRDFKVDRGRKDHWAMYPCPPKIPVVYIPDPNAPAGARVDLQGQKPHENQVRQTILYRQAPQVLTVPAGGRLNGADFSGNVIGLQTPRQPTPDLDSGIRALSFGRSIPALAPLMLGDFDGEEFRESAGAQWGFGTRFRGDTEVDAARKLKARFSNSQATGLSLDGGRVANGRELNRDVRFWQTHNNLAEMSFDLPSDRRLFETLGRGKRGFVSNDRSGEWNDGLGVSDQRGGEMFLKRRVINYGATAEDVALGLTDSSRRPDLYRPQAAITGTSRRHGGVRPELLAALRMRAGVEVDGLSLAVGQPALFNRPTRGHGLENFFFDGTVRSAKGVAAEYETLLADPAFLSLSKMSIAPAAPTMTDFASAPAYYTRPSFNGDARLFTDLVAFAPGMSSGPADVQAVLEAEAAPRFGNKRGTIDPAARALIDGARTGGWRTTLVPAGDGKTLTFVHDGRGRYAYERRVGLGLIERVVCDGARLWHLYPEIGVGAERTVTRFHRDFLFDLVPDFVPPADDLAVGADVKKLDDRTVALVPIFPASADPVIAWVEVHLVFADGRLAERRWVLNGTAAMKQEDLGLVARQVFVGGPLKVVAARVREYARAAERLSPTPAPDLAPDLSKLVVLPLPLRSREQVYAEFGLEAGQDLSQGPNPCYEYLPAGDALKLLACEFAANNGQNVGRIYVTCFRSKGDFRPGFHTLLSAASTSPRSWGMDHDFEMNRADPLLHYLWTTHNGETQNWQAKFGLAPTRTDATDFVGRLDAFRTIVHRWTGSFITQDDWRQRPAERDRALDFVAHNADNALGWAALGMVQDRCPNATVWKTLADTWGVVAARSVLRYEARYEEARCFGRTRFCYPLAQVKYQQLFRDALKEGVLPPLDSSFRSVLETGEQGEWAKLMRETAAECAKKKKRPVIVTLAWQCYQLGDVAMADTLLETALKEVPKEEKAFTLLAAVHFLNATARYDRADALVRELLAEKELAGEPGLWRLASQVADNRADRVRGIDCLERALDLEYADLPEVFDVQPIRTDYGRLLGHYEWLADASKTLKVAPPTDLVARVVKAADRWRHLDAEAAEVPNRVAALLRKIGGDGATALAWDYATTPLAVKPNEAGPWVSLAGAARQEGDWRLADQCYAMAFAAEPTNAQLLWDRAAFLQQQGQVAESRTLYRKLADAEWQPRFSGLKAQARQAVEGTLK